MGDFENVNLFYNIEESDITKLLHCLGDKTHIYSRGEFIFLAGKSRPLLGIMLSGQAQIFKENILGDRMLIRKIVKDEIFAETYACLGMEQMPVSIQATENTKVLLLDINKIVGSCEKNCSFHHIFISNLLKILAIKNRQLNEKMSYISHKTIRSRLETFLYDQAEKAGSYEFEISYNKSELADYLCIDRSAMSRELGSMKKEGFLDYTKNKFKLKQ